MSACSASRSVSNLPWAALALLLSLVSAPVQARVAGDSTKPAPSVTIDDHGVRIGDVFDDDDELTSGADTLRIVRRGLGHDHTMRFGGGTIVVNSDGDGLVRVFADAEVPAGEHVDGDVVAVFGSVDIEGSVNGDVVAVFGSVRLKPGAVVQGDVVAIGGALDHAEGATVGGQTVSLGLLPTLGGLPTLPVLLLSILMFWGLTLFIAWLMTLLFPERLERIAVTATRQSAGSFFLGVVSMPLFVLVIALLFITVIGIPIAFILPLVYFMMVWVGQVAASYVLGSKLSGRRIGEGGAMVPILTATGFVAMFFVVGAALSGPQGLSRTLALFFSLLGVLLIAGLSTIGTGALLLSRFGSRPNDVRPQGAIPPVATAGSPPPPLQPSPGLPSA
jgi:hypothetical protein